MSTGSSSRRAIYLRALFLAAAVAHDAAPALAAPIDFWQQIDALTGADKFQAAVDLLDQRIAVSRRADDETDLARALIKDTELRIGLHGYETAVRFLKDQPWPKSSQLRAITNLYYAEALVTYDRAYSWEINQRERTESQNPLDLKAWTRDEIFAEANRAYAEVYTDREALGRASVASVGSEFLRPNDYPKGIRDTLRDAVTYLWVGLLSDTAGWRAEQSNGIWQLDFASLLRGEPKPEGLALADPAVHPILKCVALLDDLRAFHERRGEAEGALEADLERLRLLQQHFTSDDERKAVEEALQKRLRGLRQLEWWSAGQAQLAELIESSGDGDNLIRARAAAQAGAQAHPSSYGGQRCAAIVSRIDEPSLSLESMENDAAHRRSVQVTHKNLPVLHFRAYAVDLVDQLTHWGHHKESGYWGSPESFLTDRDNVLGLMRTASPVATWKVELPPTPDFEPHHTFVTPPLTKNGAYLIVASPQESFQPNAIPVVATELLISDLVMTNLSPGDGSVRAEGLSAADGSAVWPVRFTLYEFDWNRAPAAVETRWSALGSGVTFGHRPNRNHFVVARKGDSWALQSNVYFNERYHPRHQESALIFTDRSVYRPLQKIDWKVVAYEGTSDKANWKLLPSAPVTVHLYDSNGEAVDSRTVTTDEFGAAAGDFTIPSGRLLGAWGLGTDLGGSRAAVRVEEYKRPTFEAKLEAPETALRLNRPATLVGEARYYFGLPLTSGSVNWRVRREPVYPFWWGWWWGAPANTASQVIGGGKASIGPDGHFHFTFTAAADERQADAGVSYAYTADVDVTDEGGETHTASRTFRLGRVAVAATLHASSGFLIAGAPAEVLASRADLDGAPRAGRATYRILALEQPREPLLPSEEPTPKQPPGTSGASYRTPGDDLRPRWPQGYSAEATLRRWSDGPEVAHGDLVHAADGIARIQVPALPAGAYRIRYATTDDFGARCETQTEILVGGDHTPLALPIFFALESSVVNVGGTARLLVGSGFAGQPLVVEIWKDGKVVGRRELTAGTDRTLLELPVRAEDRGGFAVTLRMLRDHQWLLQQQSVFVPWDDKQLSLELSTFRDRLRPGTDETWRLTVRAPGGALVKAGAAQVLAYMYDKSLDFFAPHVPPDPLSLWPSRISAGVPMLSLGQRTAQPILTATSNVLSWGWPTGDSLVFYSGYGIGGMGARGRGWGGGGLAQEEAREDAPMMRRKAMPPPSPEPVAVAASGAAPRDMDDDEDRTVEKKKETPADAPAAPAPLRTNFAETAFFLPKLLTDADGSVAIEFKVPDSVTAWSVWIHAMTRDLQSGSLHREAQTVKDLMVRPYLPRFLREGDQAELKVVVNDAADRDLEGTLAFDIFDPETHQSLLAEFGLRPEQANLPFAVKTEGGTSLTIPLVAPKRVGLVAVKVTATAGGASDGEQRPLPLLPSRLHLTQSRFAVLKAGAPRKLTFQDLEKSNDPTRQNEQLVVTVNAQLFMTMLNALPYLVNDPYECTEQTLNRFLATGILSSLYKSYPGVAAMAKQMSARTTQLETWSGVDPNRKMALEETPWLEEAKGGSAPQDQLANVLDSHVARAQREESLAKLAKAQLSTGAFPWWPGGPPSAYMTLYVVYGFSKATEFGVPVPKDVVARAFHYLAALEREAWNERLAHSIDWEFLTFLNYVCTNFPDESWINGAITPQERKEMLEYSFAHWRDHTPYLKGLLALTLERMGRPKDANLVFDSVMDSAKTTQDEGTFWAPEDRSWLWYNDTIESHAFALRTLLELKPGDPRKDGLVLWLMLNKKLNHWKSTRATAEVLYSLAKTLTADHALGVREGVRVEVDGKRQDFVFEPNEFAPKHQLVLPGPEVTPADATVRVEKSGPDFAFASATWQYATDELPKEDRGDFFKVSRRFFRRELHGREMALVPLAEGAALHVGDEIEVHVSLRSKHEAEYVHLRDPRGAGFEPVTQTSQYKWDLGIGWYEEVRDSGENFFFEQLPVGEYTFKYRLRASMAGTFRVGPASVQSMYAPEFNAFSSGAVLHVEAAP